MHKEYYFRDEKYSEEEIRNYIKNHPEKCDRYFWIVISWEQELSEDFIREFQDKVNWYDISKYQNLSEKFLIEFIDEVSTNFLEKNEKISESIKNRIINLKKVRGA